VHVNILHLLAAGTGIPVAFFCLSVWIRPEATPKKNPPAQVAKFCATLHDAGAHAFCAGRFSPPLLFLPAHPFALLLTLPFRLFGYRR
jgi:hypothetical protein